MSEAALPTCEFFSDRMSIKLDVTIKADANLIPDVVEGLMKIVDSMKCACGHEHDIELALQEALANAIVHGAGNDPARNVECCVACDEVHGMLVVVRDPGKGFDPAKLPNPTVGENLYSEHGRGIYLINQLMDHVEYKRGGTEIRMRKFPSPAPAKKDCGLG